jgi:hypothetical protein
MHFHCVRLLRFLAQMARSRARGELLPLLHARGGAVEADRIEGMEMNWSPFVLAGGSGGGDVLHMTYSARPHVVLRCDWAGPPPASLRCATAQAAGADAANPAPHIPAAICGSSAAVSLPVGAGGADFLALAHVRSDAPGGADDGPSGRICFEFAFYRFTASHGDGTAGGGVINPPRFGRLFRLPSGPPPASKDAAAFEYAHGIYLEHTTGGSGGGDVVITYGVNDERAFRVRVPLASVLASIPPAGAANGSDETLVSGNLQGSHPGGGKRGPLQEKKSPLRQAGHGPLPVPGPRAVPVPCTECRICVSRIIIRSLFVLTTSILRS